MEPLAQSDNGCAISATERPPSGKIEVEFKLLGTPEILDAIAASSLVGRYATLPCGVEELTNLYFDTPDFQLRRMGLTFRLRWNGADWLQTLKVGSEAVDGLFKRREWEQRIATSTPQIGVLPEGPELTPVRDIFSKFEIAFTTRFRRRTFQISFTGPLEQATTSLTLSLDSGTIVAGEKHMALAEVELELDSGPESGLTSFANMLRAEFALTPGSLSKAGRGYRLLGFL